MTEATLSQLFCERLEKLDPGDRARLKRSAGQTLAEAHRQALGLFYSLLPHGISPAQEETFFLVATLYPMSEPNGRGDLGNSLRLARQEHNAPGLDRRVIVLLDSDTTQLPFRLRQAIHFLQSCRVAVDYVRLLDDLLYWTHHERLVQRRWARSYFAN